MKYFRLAKSITLEYLLLKKSFMQDSMTIILIGNYRNLLQNKTEMNKREQR